MTKTKPCSHGPIHNNSRINDSKGNKQNKTHSLICVYSQYTKRNGELLLTREDFFHFP